MSYSSQHCLSFHVLKDKKNFTPKNVVVHNLALPYDVMHACQRYESAATLPDTAIGQALEHTRIQEGEQIRTEAGYESRFECETHV